MKMPLEFLQSVMDLHKCESFGDAAHYLGMTRAAHAYRLKRVEAWVDAGQLYHRASAKAGMCLTDAGKVFFRSLDRGLKTIEQARKSAQAVYKKRG